MKKVLFVANIFGHFRAFHLPYIKWLSEQGYEVHCAANGVVGDIPYCTKFYQIPIQRTIFKWKNVDAYSELKRIIESELYDLMHCHTAMGSIIARLSAIKFRKKNGLKVLYTAHEFHFYKNGSLLNWLIFYPIEVIMSFFTDAIITINAEDFNTLSSPAFRCKLKYRINSVGIDLKPFEEFYKEHGSNKINIRESLGYTQEQFILIYVGEHTQRKNHKFIIDAVPHLIEDIPDLKVIFTSRGVLWDANSNYIKQLQLEKYIDMVGFVNNLKEYMLIADVGISSSKGEGFGMNLLEEMFFKIPVVGSENKGHNEFIIHGETGFKFKQESRNEFVQYILDLYKNPDLRERIGINGREYIERFKIDNSVKAMAEIYSHFLGK